MLGTWSEHVDQLLYEGERVRERVDLEAATVVVTNDRVLVLTEDGDGTTYRHVDRPNVARVSVDVDSAPGRLFWAVVFTLLGTGLFVASSETDLPAALEDATGDVSGIVGGVLEGLETFLTVFDLSILVAAILVLTLAVLLFVSYARSRTRRLVLRVSGGEDLAIAVADADLENGRTDALRDAIGPDATAGDEGGPGESDATVEAEESG